MNREDIIRMAREAGLRTELTAMGSGSLVFTKSCAGVSDLQAFARLIAEDCAKRCEAIADEYQRAESLTVAELKTDAQTGAQDCVTAIREAYKP